MNGLITNREIKILGTLNATFLALLYDLLTLYSTGEDQVGWKIGRFTAAVWPTYRWQKNRRTPGLLFLPSYLGSKYQVTPEQVMKSPMVRLTD